MSTFLRFEPAPDRSIWAALVEAADDARLRRLSSEAQRMSATFRPPVFPDEPIFAADRHWGDFFAVIEEEEKKRLLKIRACLQ
jgi:hypothetical protein